MNISVHVFKVKGWVGVGWQRRCTSRQSLRELENPGTIFRFFSFLWRRPWLTVELEHFLRGGGGEASLRSRGMIVSRQRIPGTRYMVTRRGADNVLFLDV